MRPTRRGNIDASLIAGGPDLADPHARRDGRAQPITRAPQMATTTKKRRRNARPFLPTTMRAAAIDRTGPASVLKIHELPLPKMGARDVMIAVDTAGIGSWGPDQRSGAGGVGGGHFSL